MLIDVPKKCIEPDFLAILKVRRWNIRKKVTKKFQKIATYLIPTEMELPNFKDTKKIYALWMAAASAVMHHLYPANDNFWLNSFFIYIYKIGTFPRVCP